MLRPNPSLKSTQLEILKAGQRVTILEGPILAEGFYWRKVRAEDGTEGYVKEVGGWFAPVANP